MIIEQKTGVPPVEFCHKHGISSASFYKYKPKYGSIDVSDVGKLKALEDENAKFKKLLAEQMLDNAVLKEIASKMVTSVGKRNTADHA